MKKLLLALGFACCLPTGLAAEDPSMAGLPLGTELVLAIDIPEAATGDTLNGAVLTAHMQRVAVRDRARRM